ncbi:hypothetical protein Poly51_62060 [Rubripirellula tenax]|uniref:Uncharacterized protein n=1 Tax=Rubripirellula tenax TaxID=2528015 RepID=A0A5C6E591_9BACT|nr:hypothetical protein Poly51_62060 [Rubripirellula tenax]
MSQLTGGISGIGCQHSHLRALDVRVLSACVGHQCSHDRALVFLGQRTHQTVTSDANPRRSTSADISWARFERTNQQHERQALVDTANVTHQRERANDLQADQKTNHPFSVACDGYPPSRDSWSLVASSTSVVIVCPSSNGCQLVTTPLRLSIPCNCFASSNGSTWSPRPCESRTSILRAGLSDSASIASAGE